MENKGTPKTLLQAVKCGMLVGPLSGSVWRTRRHVRDFLAQRFGTAYLEHSGSPEIVAAMEKLWKEITGESDAERSEFEAHAARAGANEEPDY